MLFLPINGVGNNMNVFDAQKFAERVNAKHVVPMHIGMFDDLNFDMFDMRNKVIPTIYREILI